MLVGGIVVLTPRESESGCVMDVERIWETPHYWYLENARDAVLLTLRESEKCGTGRESWRQWENQRLCCWHERIWVFLVCCSRLKTYLFRNKWQHHHTHPPPQLFFIFNVKLAKWMCHEHGFPMDVWSILQNGQSSLSNFCSVHTVLLLLSESNPWSTQTL